MTNPTTAHLALTPRWVAFSQAQNGKPQGALNEVVAIDRATGNQTVVARSAWQHGQSDWVVADGDWVLWTDQAVANGDKPMAWTIRGHNLATGKTILVARSSFDSAVPLPEAGKDHVVWFQQSRDGSNVLMSHALSSGTTTALTTVDEGRFVDQVGIGANLVYFDVISDQGATSAIWKTSLLRSEQPTAFTTEHNGYAPAASPRTGLVVWQNTSGAASATSITISRPGASPVSVRTDGAADELKAGSAFIAYAGLGGLFIGPTTTLHPTQVVANPFAPCRLATSNNDIAYCTQATADGPVTRTIASVAE